MNLSLSYVILNLLLSYVILNLLSHVISNLLLSLELKERRHILEVAVYNNELIAIIYACIHSKQKSKVPSTEYFHKYLPFVESRCLYQLMQV